MMIRDSGLLFWATV